MRSGDNPILSDKDMALIQQALAYPNVGHEHFDFENGSFLLSRQSGDKATPVTRQIMAQDILVQPTNAQTRLPGAEADVPLFRVYMRGEAGQEWDHLGLRVPFAGIGSNSAQDVMRQKFMNYDPGTSFQVPILQARMEDHNVVHGAFVGGKGPVPATLARVPGNECSITVGLYDIPTLQHLTGTEPNYDGVMVDAPVRMAGGSSFDRIMAYVAVWGGITRDGKNPIPLTAIPQDVGSLNPESLDAILGYARQMTAANIHCNSEFIIGHSDAQPGIDEETKNRRTETRLVRTREIFEKHSVGTAIRGDRIFSSTVGRRADVQDWGPKPEYRPR